MTVVDDKGARAPEGVSGVVTTYVISSDCMNCGVCEFMCPTGAIVQAPNQFIIKKHLCDGCAECVPYCPAEAIVFGDINDPHSAISKRLRGLPSRQLRADLGLDPGVRYSGI